MESKQGIGTENLIKMEQRSIIKKAYDANAFTAVTGASSGINPKYWNREVLSAENKAYVLTNEGKVYSDLLNKDGPSFTVSIRGVAVKADATDEDTDADVKARAYTYVTFTPSEYTVAYQLTNKEKVRSFINLMADISMDIGIGLGLAKEEKVRDIIYAGATAASQAFNVNAGTTGSLTTSDTIDLTTINKTKKAMLRARVKPYALFVSAGQHVDLMDLDAIKDFSKSGVQSVITGALGMVSGLQIAVADVIEPASNETKAIMLSKDRMGVPSFGVAPKVMPYIESDYDVLGRFTTIVGAEDYDVQALKTKSMATILSYEA